MSKVARAGASNTNATRNLLRLLKSAGVMLPLKPELIQITIKRKRKQNRVERMWFPVIPMRQWVTCLLHECPQLLLAGHRLEDRIAWEHVFHNFWACYQQLDSQHPFFGSGISWGRGIPYLIHGDEGRGLRKVPWMVEAWQLLISHAGIMDTNESSNLPPGNVCFIRCS